MPRILLPKSGTATPGIAEGVWFDSFKSMLDGFAQSLVIGSSETDQDEITSIPDAWSRSIVFRDIFKDQKHKDQPDLVNQWLTVLRILAFRNKFSRKIEVKHINLNSETLSKRFKESFIMGNKDVPHSFYEHFVIVLIQGDDGRMLPIAAASHYTIIFVGKDIDPVIDQFIKKNLIQSDNALNPEFVFVLKSINDQLKKAVNNNFTSYQSLLDILSKVFEKNPIPPTLSPHTDPLFVVHYGDNDGEQLTFPLLRNPITSSDYIVVDKNGNRFILISPSLSGKPGFADGSDYPDFTHEKLIKFTDKTSLPELEYRHDWIYPEYDLLPNTLYYTLTDASKIFKAFGSFADKSFLEPLIEDLALRFDGFFVTLTPIGRNFRLTLEMKLENGKSVSFVREYKFSVEDSQKEFHYLADEEYPLISIWPNIPVENWNEGYKVIVNVKNAKKYEIIDANFKPIASNSTYLLADDMLLIESNFTKTEYALRHKEDKNKIFKIGFFEKDEIPVSNEKNVTTAIDFGTSNTTALVFKIGEKEPAVVEIDSDIYSSLHALSFNQKAIDEKRKDKFFNYLKAYSLPLGMIRNLSKDSNDLFAKIPASSAIISLKTDENPNTPLYRSMFYSSTEAYNNARAIFYDNLKWGGDKADYVRHYLKDFKMILKAMLISKFKIDITNDNINWVLTYPLAFTEKQKMAVMDNADRIFGEGQSRNVTDESTAVYKYFWLKNRGLFANEELKLFIDIGGGTTDYSFVVKGTPKALSSIYFGGNTVLLGNVSQDGEFNAPILKLIKRKIKQSEADSRIKEKLFLNPVEAEKILWNKDLSEQSKIQLLMKLQLKDNGFKEEILEHNHFTPFRIILAYAISAIVVESCFAYKHYATANKEEINVPTVIRFAGNGSRLILWINFLSHQMSYLRNIISASIEHVFGQKVNIDIDFSDTPKFEVAIGAAIDPTSIELQKSVASKIDLLGENLIFDKEGIKVEFENTSQLDEINKARDGMNPIELWNKGYLKIVPEYEKSRLYAFNNFFSGLLRDVFKEELDNDELTTSFLDVSRKLLNDNLKNENGFLRTRIQELTIRSIHDAMNQFGTLNNSIFIYGVKGITSKLIDIYSRELDNHN